MEKNVLSNLSISDITLFCSYINIVYSYKSDQQKDNLFPSIPVHQKPAVVVEKKSTTTTSCEVSSTSQFFGKRLS